MVLLLEIDAVVFNNGPVAVGVVGDDFPVEVTEPLPELLNDSVHVMIDVEAVIHHDLAHLVLCSHEVNRVRCVHVPWLSMVVGLVQIRIPGGEL